MRAPAGFIRQNGEQSEREKKRDPHGTQARSLLEASSSGCCVPGEPERLLEPNGMSTRQPAAGPAALDMRTCSEPTRPHRKQRSNTSARRGLGVTRSKMRKLRPTERGCSPRVAQSWWPVDRDRLHAEQTESMRLVMSFKCPFLILRDKCVPS